MTADAKTPTDVEIRARLVAALEADLVGPFLPDGDEVLPIAPSRWYLTGFLAPRAGRAPDRDDADAEGDLAAGSESRADDAGSDEPEPKRPQLFPASMGLSVLLPAVDGADAVEVEVRWADYERETVTVGERPVDGWRRVPRGPVTVEVTIDPDALRRGVAVPEESGLSLRGEVRTTELAALPPGTRVVSLFLVNDRTPRERDRDLAFAFQVGLTLRHARGFVPRPSLRGAGSDDDDQRVNALAFRACCEWAVGHNTSVRTPVPDDAGAVRELVTTQLPSSEVRRVRHAEVAGVETRMRALARLDGVGLRRALVPLVDAYAAWIDRQRAVPLGHEELDRTRDSLLDRAGHARGRLREGIALLERDAELRRAFSLANMAMHAAALQADRARADKRYGDGREPQWRPFQLAFLLLNLAGVADPTHPDRSVADLIYFPTGGGKTEAYLGLIATTLVLRRLRGRERADGGRGVAVLLRYTLRLLTLDQLGRAATLMCALEMIRRRTPELGATRFAVGLWVGRSATANRLQEVAAALHDYTPGRSDLPFPLPSCPWCSTDVKHQSVKLVGADGRPSKTRYERAVVYCAEPGCAFSERESPGAGLPVLFVDEQIYREVPDFVVATVDKFAMMPWRGDAGLLFGRATHVDARGAYGVMDTPPRDATPLPAGGLLPPELIVQDEMHLISGPLGTVVGLYETAIDTLAARAVDGVRRVPKVVCSTATVRRAREQIRALFERDMAIFPPRGIDADDDFFATVDRDRPGRLYVGVAAPGKALRAISVRVYATLLAAAARDFDPDGALDQAADPYMTLVGYFNSLRELGGMRRLVEDEVATRARSYATGKRPLGFGGPHPWGADRRLGLPVELTSRERTAAVKETKRRLATRHAARRDGDSPVDTVLASNMISVGLDVDRLGLMVVAGQPKTTSEYIQATSRVGRVYAGLVVTCLNVARPRDRSHFERFVAYHESFYREVEATSVTPFSLQTLDRGLVGTLVAMIRHGIPELEPPRGFMRLHDHRQAAEAILGELVERGRRHRDWHDEAAEQRIADELLTRGRSFLDDWEKVVQRAIDGAAERVYSDLDRRKTEGKAVLRTATDAPPADRHELPFKAPTSMRDVEPSTHVWLRLRRLDARD